LTEGGKGKKENLQPILKKRKGRKGCVSLGPEYFPILTARVLKPNGKGRKKFVRLGIPEGKGKKWTARWGGMEDICVLGNLASLRGRGKKVDN